MYRVLGRKQSNSHKCNIIIFKVLKNTKKKCSKLMWIVISDSYQHERGNLEHIYREQSTRQVVFNIEEVMNTWQNGIKLQVSTTVSTSYI